jgi:starvation-inducible outer membrane lipoprotein
MVKVSLLTALAVLLSGCQPMVPKMVDMQLHDCTVKMTFNSMNISDCHVTMTRSN